MIGQEYAWYLLNCVLHVLVHGVFNFLKRITLSHKFKQFDWTRVCLVPLKLRTACAWCGVVANGNCEAYATIEAGLNMELIEIKKLFY